MRQNRRLPFGLKIGLRHLGSTVIAVTVLSGAGVPISVKTVIVFYSFSFFIDGDNVDSHMFQWF